LPISVDAGQRAESDFGQIEVDFPEGRRTVSVLMITWAYSGAVFAIALPSEKTEAILHGTMKAFEFFGCVPKELWWDNPKTVAKTILRGRDRQLNPNYQSLASHYNFEPLFCLPARGNEKPHVEGRVKWLKRNWATPVPCVKDFAEFNAYLEDCCRQDFSRTVQGKEGTIGQRFEAEKYQAMGLPTTPFDPCISDGRDVDKYQTVAWEGVRYSVPRRDAFAQVVVKAYVDRIEAYRQGRLIARHERSYNTNEMILDPIHYLSTLECKPAYLDHTDVYKNWRLPAEFTSLRSYFEERHGAKPGARQFIQVLQLLASHPQARVVNAIKRCEREGVVTAQRIIFRCDELSRRAEERTGIDAESSSGSRSSSGTRSGAGNHVPVPDLSRFDNLLTGSRQTVDESHSATESIETVSKDESSASVLPSMILQTHQTQGGVDHAENKTENSNAARAAAIEPEATSVADNAIGIPEAGSRSSRCEPGLLGLPSTPYGTGAAISQCQCIAIAYSHGGLSGSEGTRFF
jgi:hypothetical protein